MISVSTRPVGREDGPGGSRSSEICPQTEELKPTPHPPSKRKRMEGAGNRRSSRLRSPRRNFNIGLRTTAGDDWRLLRRHRWRWYPAKEDRTRPVGSPPRGRRQKKNRARPFKPTEHPLH